MQLNTGDQFPQVRAKGLDDADVILPDLLKGAWGVVLFYRGHW
jgi:peroxiredoxin